MKMDVTGYPYPDLVLLMQELSMNVRAYNFRFERYPKNTYMRWD